MPKFFDQFNAQDDLEDDDELMSPEELEEAFDLDTDEPEAGGSDTPRTTGQSQGLAAYTDAQRQFFETQRLQLEQQRQAHQEAQEATRRAQRAAEEQARIANERKAYQERVNQYKPAPSNVSDADLAVYSAEQRNLLQGMMRRELESFYNQSISPLMTQTLDETYDRFEQIRSQQRPAGLSTEDMIRVRHPDVDELEHDPLWQAHIKEVLPEIGMTRQQIMQAAYQQGRAASVINMIDNFKQTKQNVQQQRQPRPAKSGTAHSAPSDIKGSGKKLPMSFLDRKREEMLSGLLSEARFNDIQAKYEAADVQGLVDYNR